MEQHTPTPRYKSRPSGYSLTVQWKYNDYRVEGDLAYLILRDRHGTVTGEAIIDTVDLDRVREAASWTMQKTSSPNLAYAGGMSRGTGKKHGQRRIFLHRIIMDAPSGTEVDHWNGNGLDCRRTNLRITTSKGNQNNRRQQRRERQLEDVVQRLLACDHTGPDCECRAYALEVLPSRRDTAA